ncbi:MAG: sigma 54-interacting transcriptional regulator [Thermincola sp.]|jgi:PAS domain S-box-containing protein|nr:sigma 54-interacting transcriptional regulator [Thermincola sp.]MDT3704622.1 sigma 54-interacting transcriptional regulator [Thermincola sp.]
MKIGDGKNHLDGGEPEKELWLDSLLRIFPIESDSRVKWLASILNSLHEGVVVIDLNSTIIFANSAYTRSLGVPVGKVLGKKLTDIEPDSRILDVLRSGKPIVDDPSQIKSLGGLDIVANINPIYENNYLIGVVAVFRDRSEVLHLEEKLRKTMDEVQRSLALNDRYFSELKELRSRVLETDDLVLESPQMRKITELVLRLGHVDSTVLITGESGTGKEIIAKLIHRTGKRQNKAFVTINCGAIPENLLESELFGYEKGAFTGANKEGKVGLLEIANHGTLFLDEISELPYSLQVKLLRVIQEQKFMRIGGLKEIEVDIRFLAAANNDLKTMVNEKTFREDLYYRLNVIPVALPPLRQRKQDISPMARHFLQKFNNKYGQQKKLLPEVYRHLEAYFWPGNVRELENLMERLVVSAPQDSIDLQDETLVNYFFSGTNAQPVAAYDIMSLNEAREMVEKDLIKKSLTLYGSARRAAKVLGVDPSTLIRKVRKYGLKLEYEPE